MKKIILIFALFVGLLVNAQQQRNIYVSYFNSLGESYAHVLAADLSTEVSGEQANALRDAYSYPGEWYEGDLTLVIDNGDLTLYLDNGEMYTSSTGFRIQFDDFTPGTNDVYQLINGVYVLVPNFDLELITPPESSSGLSPDEGWHEATSDEASITLYLQVGSWFNPSYPDFFYRLIGSGGSWLSLVDSSSTGANADRQTSSTEEEAHQAARDFIIGSILVPGRGADSVDFIVSADIVYVAEVQVRAVDYIDAGGTPRNTASFRFRGDDLTDAFGLVGSSGTTTNEFSFNIQVGSSEDLIRFNAGVLFYMADLDHRFVDPSFTPESLTIPIGTNYATSSDGFIEFAADISNVFYFGSTSVVPADRLDVIALSSFDEYEGATLHIKQSVSSIDPAVRVMATTEAEFIIASAPYNFTYGHDEIYVLGDVTFEGEKTITATDGSISKRAYQSRYFPPGNFTRIYISDANTAPSPRLFRGKVITITD